MRETPFVCHRNILWYHHKKNLWFWWGIGTQRLGTCRLAQRKGSCIGWQDHNFVCPHPRSLVFDTKPFLSMEQKSRQLPHRKLLLRSSQFSVSQWAKLHLLQLLVWAFFLRENCISCCFHINILRFSGMTLFIHLLSLHTLRHAMSACPPSPFSLIYLQSRLKGASRIEYPQINSCYGNREEQTKKSQTKPYKPQF